VKEGITTGFSAAKTIIFNSATAMAGMTGMAKEEASTSKNDSNSLCTAKNNITPVVSNQCRGFIFANILSNHAFL
jgi:hypothetical protein